MEKLYKLSEFAKLVGVSRSAVIKWIKEGRLEPSIFTADGISPNQRLRD